MSPFAVAVGAVVLGGLILYELEKNVLEGTIKGILGGTAGTTQGLSPAAAAGNPISVANYNRGVTGILYGRAPVASQPSWNQGIQAMHG